MNAIVWILLGAMTGWLTGKLIDEKGYLNPLLGGDASGLDIFFGLVGASIGGYLFFYAAIGQGSSVSGSAAAILGSIALVGFARQLSTTYLPFSWVRGGKRYIWF
jgi:uncharacterized membrane protein YeaQ/YmgE (transglycosylase-associated protein family)